MSELPEEIELPALSERAFDDLSDNYFEDAYRERELQLKASLAVNREQKAEIERLKDELLDGYESSTIANWRSQQIAAAKEAGVHFTEPGIACTNTRAEKAEAELASLRASAGEKPEDAWKRGYVSGYNQAEFDVGQGESTATVPDYVAPSTLPGEEK